MEKKESQSCRQSIFHMKTVKFAIVSAMISALLLGAMGRAGAATTANQTVTLPFTPTNISTTFTFSKFDSSLGTLTAINLSLFGDVKATATVDAISGPGDYDFTSGANVKLKAPGGAITYLTILPTNTDTQTITAAVFTWPAPVEGQDTKSTSLTDATNLSNFTGVGSIILPFTAQGTSGISGPGTVTASINTQLAASATLNYTYTAVPEPGTFGLMLFGLGTGVALLGRKHVGRKA